MPTPSSGLPQPFARVRDRPIPWLCVQVDPRLHVPLCERPAPLYPGVLGSGPSSVVPAHHRVLRPHPPVSPAHRDFAAQPLIRSAFAVRERLGDPQTFPTFPIALSLRAVDPTPVVPGPVPLYWGRDTRLPRTTTESPPTTPVSASYPRRGYAFRRCIVRVMLRPVGLPGPPDWLRRNGSGALCPPPRLLRYRVTPAFHGDRHRPPLGVRLEGRTGNLPSSGLSPDQFAVGSEAAP